MTVDKLLLFGAAGSIGRRHAANLQTLEPDARIIHVDPLYAFGRDTYPDWHAALKDHANAHACVIASPTGAHLAQMKALLAAGIPFYVEKPPCEIAEQEEYAAVVNEALRLGLRSYPTRTPKGLRIPCAVGFQYRWHPNVHVARWREKGVVRFYARDDLVQRYGAACLEIMASHPIDSALYAFGPAREVNLHTDGLSVGGEIRHENGGVSEFDIRIDSWPRVSYAMMDFAADALEPTNKMYRRALAGWLAWVQGGPRDARTATLEEGLAVMRVMEKAGRIPGFAPTTKQEA